MATPKEIAHGAMDRLCDYDVWDAPGDYATTANRISEFMASFVAIAASRLAGVVEHGHGTPVADAQESGPTDRWVEQRQLDDCLWACIASVLGFDPLEGNGWVKALAAPTAAVWDPILVRHGFHFITAPPSVVANSQSALWILVARSLHDEHDGHAVVMRGRALVWDPGHRIPRYDQARVDNELANATGAGNGRTAILLLPTDPGTFKRDIDSDWAEGEGRR